MSKNQSRPDLSLPVLLKSGTQKPAVFLVPGIGGSAVDFVSLAKYIQGSRSIYALQPRGLDGLDSPCDRIEEMAEYYLQIVLWSQPQGPYILVGYSLGGMVAMEMARILIARQQEVALLVMIDSYPDIRSLSPIQSLRLFARRKNRRLVNFVFSSRRNNHVADPAPPDGTAVAASFPEQLRVSATLALRRYRPRPFGGAVRFIRAATVTEFPKDPQPVWSHLVRALSVETVTGDHLDLLNGQSEKLAAVLSRYLESLTSSE